MNLLGKTMSSFNFMAKPKNIEVTNASAAVQNTGNLSIQGPALIDLAIPSNNRSIKPIEKKIITEKAAPKETPSTLSLGRKKINSRESNLMVQATNEESSKVVNKQNNNTFIQCQFKFEDESKSYLEVPFNKTVNLAPEELEEILLFIEDVEQKRKKQEKEQQEKRSWAIIQKIASQSEGQQFLEEHCISNVVDEETKQEEWVQSIVVMKADGEAEEISQPLNFYNPQHSWILENWLSKQAVSWMVKRYSSNNDQVIYQVSFGFPDQTFLEAEGPSREGSILAVAEDLYD